MPTPPAFSNAQKAKRDFGVRLGEIRKSAGYTGRALAKTAGWHESKVSRIENGVTSPSHADVRVWVQACGAAAQVDDLLASLDVIEGMFVEWRRLERTGLKRVQQSVLPLWERTTRFRTYSPWLIPGAAQTEAYTRAVLRGTAKRRNLPDDIDDAVAVRKDRLGLLHDSRRSFAVLMEESVLRTVIGGPDVMAGQLGHLLVISELPTISVGVVPFGVERADMPPAEDFWIFDSAQANVELTSGYLTITHPGEIAMYADAFKRLSDLAVVGVPARRLITAAIDALD